MRPVPVLRIAVGLVVERGRIEGLRGVGRIRDQDLPACVVIALAACLCQNLLGKGLRRPTPDQHGIFIRDTLQKTSEAQKCGGNKGNSSKPCACCFFIAGMRSRHAQKERKNAAHGHHHLHVRFRFRGSEVEAVGRCRQQQNAGGEQKCPGEVFLRGTEKAADSRQQHRDVQQREPRMPDQPVGAERSVQQIVSGGLVTMQECGRNCGHQVGCGKA